MPPAEPTTPSPSTRAGRRSFVRKLAGPLLMVLAAAACTTAAEHTSFEQAAPDTTAVAPAPTIAPPNEKPADPTLWRPLGEPGIGGRITAVAIDPRDPDHLLAGGDMIGVAVSQDGGTSWQSAFGLTNGEVSRFTFSTSEPGVVWLATMGGPFLSTDGGHSWQARRGGMPAVRDIGYSAPIEEILIDPADPNHLLAFGGSHRGWDAPGTTGWGAVWDSIDHGATWSRVATVGTGKAAGDGVGIVDATRLADGALLVTSDQGIFRSIDGGRSWSPSNTGLPSANVRAVAAHPSDPAIVWAALGAVSPPSAFVPTTVAPRGVGATAGDDGLDDASGTTAPPPPSTLYPPPTSPATPGGVFKSTDGGLSWTAARDGLNLTASAADVAHTPRYDVIEVAPSDPDVLLTANLAAGAQAVFRSTDGGTRWLQVIGADSLNRPLSAYNSPLTAEAAAIDPTDAQHAVIGNAEFLLATTDGGRRWRDISSDASVDGTATGRGFSGLVANRVTYSSDGREISLCGYDGANPLLSRDGARRWSRPLVGSDPWGGCLDVAYSASAPGRRYVLVGQAGVFGGVVTIEANGSYRLAAGAAAGLPERYRDVGELGAIEVVSRADGSETVAVAAGGVLYLSDDAAATFAVADAALGANELAADASHPGRLYVGGANGIGLSDDAGASVFVLPGAPSHPARLRIEPVTGRLYATVWRSAGAGLWRFDGAQWAKLLDEPTTFDVAVDPADPNLVLVATNDHPFHDVIASPGVLRSTDGGQSWNPFNTGLPLLRVVTISFDPAVPGRVVIGTYGRGFFVADNARRS